MINGWRNCEIINYGTEFVTFLLVEIENLRFLQSDNGLIYISVFYAMYTGTFIKNKHVLIFIVSLSSLIAPNFAKQS